MVRLSALDLPTLPPTNGTRSLSGGAPRRVRRPAGRRGATDHRLARRRVRGVALGTGRHRQAGDDRLPRQGRLRGHLPQGRRRRGGRRAELRTGSSGPVEDLVFITSDAQLLRFSAGAVRPQGRGGGGIAGIKLAAGQRVAFFGAVWRPTPWSSPPPGPPGPSRAPRQARSRSRRMPSTRRRGAPPVGCAATVPQGRGHPRLAGATPARAAAANGVALELPPAGGDATAPAPPPLPQSPASPAPGGARVTVGRSARTSAGWHERAGRLLGALRPGRCQRLRDGGACGVLARGRAVRPWGRSAATESHLPVEVGRRLDEECARRGGRLSLLRAPGPHPDVHHGGRAATAFSVLGPRSSRHVGRHPRGTGVAGPRRPRSRRCCGRAEGACRGPSRLSRSCWSAPTDARCLLRRARAAGRARRGRGGTRPGLECSHTGGHRFAPTGVLPALRGHPRPSRHRPLRRRPARRRGGEHLPAPLPPRPGPQRPGAGGPCRGVLGPRPARHHRPHRPRHHRGHPTVSAP